MTEAAMEKPISFDDLDDFDTVQRPSAPPRPDMAKIDPASRVSLGAGRNAATVARFPCSKCKGSGRFISYSGRDVGPCNRCKGSGKQKTDTLGRQARERAARAERLTAWVQANKPAADWIAAKKGSFEFALSMHNALIKDGSLTQGQMDAINRCIANDIVRAKERAERKADVDVAGVGFDRMLKAFAAAKASGLKHPKFHVAKLVFSLAKAESANAGCLYVKSDGVYIGKITAAGAFFAGRDCSAEDKAEVARIGADPLGAAVMHGKQTGSCSCCGRELENAESVALGIGPVCRRKWGL